MDLCFSSQTPSSDLRIMKKLIEPIFYSGTGVYDFQYLEFLERKYKYDKEWLAENKGFNFSQAKYFVLRVKEILHEKSKKVHLYDLKKRLPEMIENMKKENPHEDWGKHIKDILPMMELHQYVDLFFEDIKEKSIRFDEIKEAGWKSFYRNFSVILSHENLILYSVTLDDRLTGYLKFILAKTA